MKLNRLFLGACALAGVAFGQSPPPQSPPPPSLDPGLMREATRGPQVEPLGDYQARMAEQRARTYALTHEGWTPEERREERERIAAFYAKKQAAKDAKKAAKEAAKAAKLAAKDRRKAS